MDDISDHLERTINAVADANEKDAESFGGSPDCECCEYPCRHTDGYVTESDEPEDSPEMSFWNQRPADFTGGPDPYYPAPIPDELLPEAPFDPEAMLRIIEIAQTKNWRDLIEVVRAVDRNARNYGYQLAKGELEALPIDSNDVTWMIREYVVGDKLWTGGYDFMVNLHNAGYVIAKVAKPVKPLPVSAPPTPIK